MITVENKDVSVVRCCWYIWKEKKNEGRKKIEEDIYGIILAFFPFFFTFAIGFFPVLFN